MSIIISSSVYGEELVLDGLPVEMEAVIIDGNAYFPAREAYEAIGCDVEWDNKTKTMLITEDNLKKSIKVRDGKVYEIDDKGNEYVNDRIQINVINSKFYIPLREMFEKLGYYVEWNGDLKRIEVSRFLSDEKSAFIENRVDMSDDIGLYNYLNGGLATVHNGYILFGKV